MAPGLEALRHGAAWLDLSARGRIVARGRDRARLLHNLTSNEVKKLAPGAGCYAFLLNPQGRIQADLNLFAFEDHFLIDTEPELREKVFAHIRRYIIADQVELEDVTERLAAVGLEGPGSAPVLASLGAAVPGVDFAHNSWGDSVVAAAAVTGQPGFRIFTPRRDEILRQLETAGAKPATDAEAREVRMENGKPRYGDDIGDTSLPQETQQMHAVSFTKGCYLGQEIVERIRAQGHVNRKLVRVEIDAAEPLPRGTKLQFESADVGELTSSVFSGLSGKVAGFAYVRSAHAEPGAILQAGGSTVRVR